MAIYRSMKSGSLWSYFLAGQLVSANRLPGEQSNIPKVEGAVSCE